MRYLVAKYGLPDHWYPADIVKRARVDEYLSWHSSNLRIGAAELIFSKAGKKFTHPVNFYAACLQVFMPSLLGKEGDPERLAQLEALLGKSKKMLETYFLKDHKFICGDQISIADLQAVCELTQFWVAGSDPCEGRPTLARWMGDVQTTLKPHFDEVHNMVYMARDREIFKGKL